MAKTYWRKRVGSKSTKANFSYSKSNGFGASYSLRSSNSKGLGWNYNSKKGMTIALRGTGLRWELGGATQKNTKRKSNKATNTKSRSSGKREANLLNKVIARSNEINEACMELAAEYKSQIITSSITPSLSELHKKNQYLKSLDNKLQKLEALANKKETYYNKPWDARLRTLTIRQSVRHISVLNYKIFDFQHNFAQLKADVEHISDKGDVSSDVIDNFNKSVNEISCFFSEENKNFLLEFFPDEEYLPYFDKKDDFGIWIKSFIEEIGLQIDLKIDQAINLKEMLGVGDLFLGLVEATKKYSEIFSFGNEEEDLKSALNGLRVNIFAKSESKIEELIANDCQKELEFNQLWILINRLIRLNYLYGSIGAPDSIAYLPIDKEMDDGLYQLFYSGMQTRFKVLNYCKNVFRKKNSQLGNSITLEMALPELIEMEGKVIDIKDGVDEIMSIAPAGSNDEKDIHNSFNEEINKSISLLQEKLNENLRVTCLDKLDSNSKLGDLEKELFLKTTSDVKTKILELDSLIWNKYSLDDLYRNKKTLNLVFRFLYAFFAFVSTAIFIISQFGEKSPGFFGGLFVMVFFFLISIILLYGVKAFLWKAGDKLKSFRGSIQKSYLAQTSNYRKHISIAEGYTDEKYEEGNPFLALYCLYFRLYIDSYGEGDIFDEIELKAFNGRWDLEPVPLL